MAYMMVLFPLKAKIRERGKFKKCMNRQDRLDKLAVGVRSGRGT